MYTNARQCVACVSSKSIKFSLKYHKICVRMLPKLVLLFCGTTSSYMVPRRSANLKTRFFEFSKFCAAGANFLKISRRSRKLQGRGFYAPRCAKSARYTAFLVRCAALVLQVAPRPRLAPNRSRPTGAAWRSKPKEEPQELGNKRCFDFQSTGCSPWGKLRI